MKRLKALIETQFLENKEIDEDVILLKLDQTGQEPWSFLFFAGYITANSPVFKDNQIHYTLAIPNQEIKELYKKLVLNAIGKKFSPLKLEKLLKALIQGDVVLVNSLLGEFIMSFCSSHDLPKKRLREESSSFCFRSISFFIRKVYH